MSAATDGGSSPAAEIEAAKEWLREALRSGQREKWDLKWEALHLEPPIHGAAIDRALKEMRKAGELGRRGRSHRRRWHLTDLGRQVAQRVRAA